MKRTIRRLMCKYMPGFAWWFSTIWMIRLNPRWVAKNHMSTFLFTDQAYVNTYHPDILWSVSPHVAMIRCPRWVMVHQEKWMREHYPRHYQRLLENKRKVQQNIDRNIRRNRLAGLVL
jgi:hypothetical protein